MAQLRGASKIAQWIKMSDTKSDDLSLTPMTCMIQGEDQRQQYHVQHFLESFRLKVMLCGFKLHIVLYSCLLIRVQ